MSVSNAKLRNRRGGRYLLASPSAIRRIMQVLPRPGQTQLPWGYNRLRVRKVGGKKALDLGLMVVA